MAWLAENGDGAVSLCFGVSAYLYMCIGTDTYPSDSRPIGKAVPAEAPIGDGIPIPIGIDPGAEKCALGRTIRIGLLAARSLSAALPCLKVDKIHMM